MDGGSTSGGSICLYATGGSSCLYATLDPHLLVALPEAASSLAPGNACPDGVASGQSRMDTAFTGMPVESEARPIPLVARGQPLIPAKAGIHLARAGQPSSKLTSAPLRDVPHGFPPSRE